MSEPFDSLKLHQSIVAACLSVRALEGDAHHTAERVCRHVLSWLAHHGEVTSADIRRKAAQALTIYHPDASYMYEHHQLIA
jgi:hypothetical protein